MILKNQKIFKLRKEIVLKVLTIFRSYGFSNFLTIVRFFKNVQFFHNFDKFWNFEHFKHLPLPGPVSLGPGPCRIWHMLDPVATGLGLCQTRSPMEWFWKIIKCFLLPLLPLSPLHVHTQSPLRFTGHEINHKITKHTYECNIKY